MKFPNLHGFSLKGGMAQSASVKTGQAYIVSLIFCFAALIMSMAARHQFANALRHAQFVHTRLPLDILFLYSSWILTIGCAELLSESRRRREPGSPWPVVFLLGLLLYLNLLP